MAEACKYIYKDGHQCDGDKTEDGFCRWHSPNIEKGGPDDIRAIEEWAKSGRSMEGFHLKRANLEGINLVCPNREGYDMTNAVLDRACFNHAHLYHLNLDGASLLKTDFDHANLNFAVLTNTNLLGTVLHETKIEHCEWDEHISQDVEADEALEEGDKEKAKDYFQQAEEIYRNLRKATEARGQFETAGDFFYKEMVMRRRQMDQWSLRWLYSHLVDWSCGYGEKPMRVVAFSSFVIFASAICYFILGIQHNDEIIRLSFEQTLWQNILHFGNCIYFSVVTFTTLGYGDMIPTPLARIIVTGQAFVGSFTLALFVVVFVEKMTR